MPLAFTQEDFLVICGFMGVELMGILEREFRESGEISEHKLLKIS